MPRSAGSSTPHNSGGRPSGAGNGRRHQIENCYVESPKSCSLTVCAAAAFVTLTSELCTARFLIQFTSTDFDAAGLLTSESDVSSC